MPKLIQYILVVQGIYYLATGLWGAVDIRSFMIVTGPKTDVWLIKTVSLLLSIAGITYLISAREKQLTIALKVLIPAVAGVLLFIDVYYNFKGIISNVYLVDGFIQFVFVLVWLFHFAKEKSS
jgi:hypothetical protein